MGCMLLEKHLWSGEVIILVELQLLPKGRDKLKYLPLSI